MRLDSRRAVGACPLAGFRNKLKGRPTTPGRLSLKVNLNGKAEKLMPIFILIISFALLAGCPDLGFAEDGNVIVLDCTSSNIAADLTSKFPVVYLSAKNFDPAKFSENGEISQADFGGLIRTGLKKPKGTIRFKVRKNDSVDVYIVTSIRMDTFEQAAAPAAPPLQWVSDPIIFMNSIASRASGPVTTSSQPLTLSIMKTARFLLKEQQRPTSLESTRYANASSVFGVTFKVPRTSESGQEEQSPSDKIYYYYRQKYKMKFDNSVLNLSFEDQSGNQENVASVFTGASDNWFLTAGSPIVAFNRDSNDFGGNPTGLYLGLNWTPNDLFDPNARFLIVNFLDVNTTNPTTAIGLVGLGMGFPKTSKFIPLSTLSVTEVLAYNLTLSKFQFLTMINYDVTDILQLLKL